MVVNSYIYDGQISFIFVALAFGVILLFVMQQSEFFRLWNIDLQERHATLMVMNI